MGGEDGTEASQNSVHVTNDADKHPATAPVPATGSLPSSSNAAVTAATAALAVEESAALPAAGAGAFGPPRQPPPQHNDECELECEGPT